MYYVLLRDLDARTAFIEQLGQRGVNAVFHYVPLHTSDAGRRFGTSVGELPVTSSMSDRLVRLPLWVDLRDDQIERVVEAVKDVVAGLAPRTVPASQRGP
jgi:dTDP-4-amino-4,6-dideoxygalactose transaminase